MSCARHVAQILHRDVRRNIPPPDISTLGEPKSKMSRPDTIIRCLVTLTALLSVCPSPAAAQTTTNPTSAQFDASADHSATDGSGTPLVGSYEIGLYILGAQQPFQTVSIGKPTPDGTGTITVDMRAAFLGWPIVGMSYTADVAAMGPGGVARSTRSNTFNFTGNPCSFNVSSTLLNVPATSGSYATTVATTSSCAWTGVSNNTSWITVTGGSSGSGNGTVSFTVAANTSASPRTGTLTIAGVTVTVTQAGACAYTVAPTTQSVLAAGGSQSVAVTTASGCNWTGVSNDTTWIAITSGSSGAGTGAVSYTVATNTAASARTGTLTIAGQTVTVTQAGACAYTVAPTTQSVLATGGSQSVAVTTASGCNWTGVSNDTTWIAITSGSSGAGTGAVSTPSQPTRRRALARGR